MHLGKKLLVLSVIAITASAAHFLDQKWMTWKSKYGKKYTGKEETFRRQAWEATWAKVQKHNALAAQGLKNYTLAMNQFADMTSADQKSMNCLSCPHQNAAKPATDKVKTISKKYEPDFFPEHVDWRDSNCVTPVKNQGSLCGSCWAFCTVSVLETRYCIKHNKLLSFSEQQFVDCDSGNEGCCGGMPHLALSYAYHRKIMESKDYEYTETKFECLFSPEHAIDLNMTKFYNLLEEDNIARSVAMDGPVTIAFGVSFDFMLYDKGIFDGECTASINHGMTIIGYGSECDVDYWLIRNSWGEIWGDKGYAKVKRNVNQCFIADYAATGDIPGPE